MARNRRRERREGGQQPRPSRHVEIAYKRPSDFRVYYADGTLVRIQRGAITLGFYVDDMRVTGQAGTLMDTKGSYATYQAGAFKEEFVRLEQVAIRMPLDDAESLAQLLIQKVQEARSLIAQGEQSKSDNTSETSK